MSDIEKAAARAGLTPFDWQVAAVNAAIGQPGRERLCLYHRTGAGKTATSLLAMAVWGWNEALVVAPPSTHATWEGMGTRFGIKVECMSHQKFRMKGTKVSRNKPVIADEFHMFGRNTGAGFKKLDALAGGLQAPLIVASATPNYNDADRVYCVQHILDPLAAKGGLLQFLFKHCELEHDPFSQTPKVLGFHNFANAEDFLASLPGVAYLPDELVWSITEVEYDVPRLAALDRYGYIRRKHKMCASQMEERHIRRQLGLVTAAGPLKKNVDELLWSLCDGPTLIFCMHATVAKAAFLSFTMRGVTDRYLLTGEHSREVKEQGLQDFLDAPGVLIGTSAIATGTDGLDKVIDTLIILDDTDDDALRRQIVGRIMPRGEDSDASMKKVYRFNPRTL